MAWQKNPDIMRLFGVNENVYAFNSLWRWKWKHADYTVFDIAVGVTFVM